jgi:hypothetical protein
MTESVGRLNGALIDQKQQHMLLRVRGKVTRMWEKFTLFCHSQNWSNQSFISMCKLFKNKLGQPRTALSQSHADRRALF